MNRSLAKKGTKVISVLSEKVHYIVQNLRAVYGVPQRETPLRPLDELILTILSQSTTNVNSNRTFANLKKRFRSWEEVRTAGRTSIESAIKAGGLGRQKSQRIKSLLNEIYDRTGQTNLDFLCGLPVSEAIAFLASIKGVGPITVACTLLFACNQPLFPVDTHILRIARRLGIIPQQCTDAEAHTRMAKALPTEQYYEVHINLIRHGRTVCRPREPLCETCSLVDYCEYYRKL